MAERIDIRMHVRGDGQVRAYAERWIVPDVVETDYLGTDGPSTEFAWPVEFDGEPFRSYGAIGDVLYATLRAIDAFRDREREQADNADPDEPIPDVRVVL